MSTNIFDEVINRKGTYSTQWDYVEDRFGKKDLLPFTISDTDFAAPKNVMDALQNRLDHRVFGYTRWNHADYKNSITYWFKKRFAADVDSNWIVYSPSVIYSIARLIEMNSEEEDGVIIQTPAYDAFFKTINASKRELIENPLIYRDGIYKIDFNDLEAKLEKSENKILLICNPHNPTGRVWSEEDLKKIIGLCKKHNVFLISDDIHMDMTRKNIHYHPITSYYKQYENMALCTSTSKSFNVPGLGGSYLFIPNGELRNKFQFLLKNRDGLSSANIFGITATMAAYTEEGADWMDELNEYIDSNLELVEEFIAEKLPELTFKKPESTYLAWIDIQGLNFSMEELQKTLVDRGEVAIMAGTIYGGNGDSFLRLNVGCSRSKVEIGLQKLEESIIYLQEKE